MTLSQARDLIAKTLSHSDMEIEFDKAVWMLLNCADEKINGGWIPVTERLPEEDNCTGSGVQFSDDVLMSVLNIVNEEDFIDFGHTIDGEWYSIVEKKRIQNGFDVIAWMPLPQPYKAESEEV